MLWLMVEQVTSPRRPLAGKDYPRSYQEFHAWFPDDQACAAYLADLRWPDGFLCPACGVAQRPWTASRGRLVCAACRHQTSVTAGTVLDKTRTALVVWFEAAWHVTTAKNGLSAKTLERTLDVSYPTAWTLLHRFRVAMVRSERAPLSGTVEVDETFVGGKAHDGSVGRGAARKSLVAIAVEVKHPKGYGRTRMQKINSGAASELVPFVSAVVKPGSTVRTDGWSGYVSLPKHGYDHDRISQRAGGNPAHITMPAVHRVASLLKRWLLGTHQGAVDPAYLPSYLEEYTFRFNRRASRSRGLVFRRLLEQAVVTGPLTAADIQQRARA
jgi:transposase-like protein